MPEISCGAAGDWHAFSPSRRCIGRFSLRRAFCWSVICAVGLVTSGWNSREAFADSDVEFFEARIRPLLVDRCYGCHSADSGKRHGELALDTKQGWEVGGVSGPAIVPGDATASLLFRAVQYSDSDLQMPPEEAGGKLSESEIALLLEWINRGAFDPRVAQLKVAGMDAAEAKSWWAFQPLRESTDRGNVGIDRILDHQLVTAGLTKAPVADKRTLLRRATFDLIGLPPSPEEMADFLADGSPVAFARVIDRLLASPQYGERWGRHWLDLARYADSFDARGYGESGDIAEAWRYRDWVVSSLNRDLPYDSFVRDQVAGDILGTRETAYDAAQIIATGAYAIGNWGNGDADKQKIHTDIVDDQIDFTGRAFLGITLACARCHDHKFDPLTTRDYHAMAGFFYSSRILENFTPPGAGEQPLRIVLQTPAERSRQQDLQRKVAEIEASLKVTSRPFRTVEDVVSWLPGPWPRVQQGSDAPSLVVRPFRQMLQGERAKLMANNMVPPKAVGLAEGGIRNTTYNGFHNARIHKRGRYDQLSEEVPRGVPALLATTPLVIVDGSGRLELANWIASPKNPLTARVMVNRIWQYHFGHGLVRTPNNFGKLGQPPTHPDLLDWLAREFIESSWSMKHMHRLIMSSAAYQRSSSVVFEGNLKDAENTLLSHQNRRRLSAEELRDSLLVAAGTMDSVSGGPPARDVSVPRRTLYIATIRSDRSGFRPMFDGANPLSMVDIRTDSVVATQALWLMNNEFALSQVSKLALLLENQPGGRSERLNWLTNRLFQRLPTKQEEALANRVVIDATSGASWEPLCQVFLCTNEFTYVD